MTTRHYCTYFDHRYLARGLALHESLRRFGDAQLWVLALSGECESALRGLARPGLRIVTLAELEAFDPQLAACRADRSLVEYYFTCSPSLPRYVLNREPAIDGVSYVDSDLYFFADPELMFDEIAGCSVAITPHRFSPPALASHGKYGRYNVGLVHFRRDDNGLACLEWWRERCQEWCHDRLEGGRYADQKYLERFEELFDGVCAIAHAGANLAPWNIAVYTIGGTPRAPTVDGLPVIFFHFQGVRRISPGRYDSNLSGYGARLSPGARSNVYEPYLSHLAALEQQLLSAGILEDIAPSARRAASGLLKAWRRAKQLLLQAQAQWLGNIVRIPAP